MKQQLQDPFKFVDDKQAKEEIKRLQNLPEGATDLGKSPEVKEYLVLVQYTEDGTTDFQFINGRTATYEYLKSVVDKIDLDESYVIVETVKIKDRITVYEFLKMCKDRQLFDDDFDIDEIV